MGREHVDIAETLRRYRVNTVRRVLTRARRTTSFPIELVEWTQPSWLRRALANAGVPRILLVAPGDSPPSNLGVDEAWLPMEATDAEVEQCARKLLERLAADNRVELIGERVWTYAGRTFRLTPLQARLFAELSAHRGIIVTHERLMAVGWKGEPVNHMSLDSAMRRLRDHLVGTGLCVRSRRTVGFVLA